MTRYRAGGEDFGGDVRVRGDLAIDGDQTLAGDSDIGGNLAPTTTTGTEKFEVMILPALATSVNQSVGNVIESDGSIYFDAADTLYLFLSGFVPHMWWGDEVVNVRLDYLTVYIVTTDGGGGGGDPRVDQTVVWEFDLLTGATAGIYTDPTDIGGSGSDDYHEKLGPINIEFEANKTYHIALSLINLGGGPPSVMIIRSVKAHFSLVE